MSNRQYTWGDILSQPSKFCDRTDAMARDQNKALRAAFPYVQLSLNTHRRNETQVRIQINMTPGAWMVLHHIEKALLTLLPHITEIQGRRSFDVSYSGIHHYDTVKLFLENDEWYCDVGKPELRSTDLSIILQIMFNSIFGNRL